MTTSIPDPATALELEKLRSTLGVGFAEIKGSLALLVQRSDQTDRALGDHRDQLTDHDKRIGELEQARASGEDHDQRISALERRVWSASGTAALLGTAAGIAGQYFLGG